MTTTPAPGYHPTTREGLSPMTEQPIAPRPDRPIVTPAALHHYLDEHHPTRLARLEACVRILDADLAAHPPQSPDDRDLALAALRGWIADEQDGADDAQVAAFYIGQYEADGTKPVVNYEALPVEHKRSWRRKFRAARKTITTTPSTREG